MNLNTSASETSRFSGQVSQTSNSPKPDDNTYVGSCTFLNLTGDITIVWDAQNREKVLAVIQKQMDAGVTFFTTKRFLFERFTRTVKVSKSNIGQLSSLIITDDQFDKMVKDMDDSDLAQLVASNSADLVKRKGKTSLAALARAKRAEDVVDCDSVAVRPLRGG